MTDVGITFLENSLRTEDFSLALLERRPAIGEFAWFLAKTHSAMKDSRWGSGMKVARSASAIARKWKRRTRAKARDYIGENNIRHIRDRKSTRLNSSHIPLS